MHSIGDRLRQERLRRGFDLGQISDLTKINPAMLEAIEADDFDKLPGSFFARSFVRQYAKALGLDESELEEELERAIGYEEPQLPDPDAAAQALSVAPVAVPSARRRPGTNSLAALGAFIVIVAACSAVYTLVERSHRAAEPAPAAVTSVPAPTPQTPVETPTPAAPSPTPEATPTAAESPMPAATATPMPEAEASVPEGPGAAIRLELHTSAEVWVRVTSDGKNLFSGVLQPGEARVFEGQSRVTVRTGNAAALAVTYNGQPVGEIGAPNQVRTMQFTPTGFSFVTPAAPKPQTSPVEP